MDFQTIREKVENQQDESDSILSNQVNEMMGNYQIKCRTWNILSSLVESMPFLCLHINVNYLEKQMSFLQTSPTQEMIIFHIYRLLAKREVRTGGYLVELFFRFCMDRALTRRKGAQCRFVQVFLHMCNYILSLQNSIFFNFFIIKILHST